MSIVSTPIRILLIEDNPGDARLIREMLLETDYVTSELVVVSTLAEAIAESNNGKIYTLVLLDLSLPDSYGIASIKSTRQHFPDSTLIILTGYKDDQTAVFAIREGAQNYLVKGEFDAETLSKTIHFSQERHNLILKLHHSEADLRAIFDNTNVGYILTDTGFQVKSYNKVAEQWVYEVFQEEIQPSSNLRQILSRSNLDSEALLVPPLSGLGAAVEEKMRGISGIRWYEINTFPVYNYQAQVLGISFSVHDITARKKNELERENILTELVKKNNDLEQFAYIISHNLRAPVANIIALTDLIQQADITDEDKSTILIGLSESAHKLDTVVSDLTQILQIKMGVNEQKELVQFSALLRDISSVLATQIQENKVEINTDFSPINDILTVKSYLHSIFYNLVANSIKYRKPGLRPVISIRSQLSGNMAELTFSDNGQGIDMERYGNKIFGLYKRFHPGTEGRGIGLYMTHAQVSLLGGQISVDSKPGEGTVFTLMLPL